MQSSSGQEFINIGNLFNLSGKYSYDPCFSNTASCLSSITHIDPIKGTIKIRGIDHKDLIKDFELMEVWYLLWYGKLPSTKDLSQFKTQVIEQMTLHEKIIKLLQTYEKECHPMSIMIGVMGALAGFMKTTEYVHSEK